MSAESQSLTRKAASGVMWTATSQGVRQVLQIIITAILVRQVTPQEFGLIAMAMVAVHFLAPLHDVGLSAALVQKKKLEPGHASAVFWVQFGLSVLTAGILYFVAPWIALFFDQPTLIPYLQALTLILPIGAVGTVAQALTTKALRFKRIAVIETTALAAGGVAGILVAVRGGGAWSLVVQAVATTLTTTLLMMLTERFNPLRLKNLPARRHLKDLLEFCAPLTVYQLLNFVSRNIDDILIGKILGSEALGWYSMAYRIMMYPLQKVSRVLGKVSFPTFAAIQEDNSRIRRGYLKSIEYVSLVSFPIIAGLMTLAPELTALLFGPGWEPVAPLITILCIGGIAGTVGTTIGSLFLSKGATNLMLRWEAFACTCYVIAMVIGIRWGLLGMTWAYSLTALLLWPISQWVANRLIELKMLDVVKRLLPPFAMAAVMALGIFGLKQSIFASPLFDALKILLASGLWILIILLLCAWLRFPKGLREMLELMLSLKDTKSLTTGKTP